VLVGTLRGRIIALTPLAEALDDNFHRGRGRIAEMRIPDGILLNTLGFRFQIVARTLQIPDEPLNFCNRRRSYILNELVDRFAQFAAWFRSGLDWMPRSANRWLRTVLLISSSIDVSGSNLNFEAFSDRH